MKMLIAITAGMLAVGTGYHFQRQAPEKGAVPPAQAPGEVRRYELYVAGNAVACQVTKGRQLSGQIAEIKLSEGCGEAYARLARAALWRSGRNGDVAFAAKDGQTLVRFASGDGIAYESYRPTVPFLSLVAAR